MSGVVAFIRRCVSAGMDYDTALAAAEQFETGVEEGIAKALEQRRSADRERQQRRRERKAGDSHVTSRESRDERDKKEVPKPLRKNTTPSPPKGGSVPTIADEIWALQPTKHRRSTKPDVRKAVAVVLRRDAPADVLASCQAYYALPNSIEDDGKYAMGAARLLAADRWRDFLPGPDPAPLEIAPELHAKLVQRFRDTGEWKPAWGPRPEDQAA